MRNWQLEFINPGLLNPRFLPKPASFEIIPAMEKISYQPTELEAWGVENIEEITHELEEGRALIYRGKVELGDSRGALVYAPDKRALSEMPVCRALGNIHPPHGYKKVDGRVYFVSNDRKLNEPHTFFTATDDPDQILCLTSGQFVDCNELNTKPNQRIKRMKMEAPGLIHTLSEEVSILAGTKQKIKQALNLAYVSYTG